MESRINNEAKKDLPLYFEDFKKFWNESIALTSDNDIADCYANTLIFKNWKLGLNSIGVKNLDGILDEIHEDINSSFSYSLFGQYRSAHMHLRSVIELSLQLLYFYQHEIEYQQWREGEFLIKHEELTGYLKRHPFLKTHQSENLITLLTSDWKKFSKHIHAESPLFFQTVKKSKISKAYDKGDAGVWRSNFINTGYRVNKLFLIFYKNIFSNFPSQNKQLLLRNIPPDDLLLINIES